MANIQKKRILFIAEGVSRAHPTRLSVLANELDPEIYDLHFATTLEFASSLDLKDGITFHSFRSLSNAEFNRRLFETTFPKTSQEWESDIKEDEALLAKVTPDLIVSDFRLSIYTSAKKRRIPVLNLIQFHWYRGFERPNVVPYIKPVALFGRKISEFVSAWVTPFFYWRQKQSVNALERKNNEELSSSLVDFYCRGTHLLFPELPEVYEPLPVLNDGTFIGPIIWKKDHETLPKNWGDLPTDRRFAYVTMGSTGDEAKLELIIKHLIELGFNILLSAKEQDYCLKFPDRVWQAPFIPADLALQKSVVHVCNGGTSSTYHALMHGVLVLGIPMNADQCFHMDRLKRMKYAEMIFFDQVNEKNFSEKMQSLLNSQEIRENTLKAQNSIQQTQRNKAFEKVVKRFLSEQRG